jgi:mono/diheme cytochrome c family protein
MTQNSDRFDLPAHWKVYTEGMRAIVIAATVALTLVACDSGGGAATDIDPQDAALIETGQELYRASCAVCHGVDLTGSSTGPSLLSEVYEPGHHSDLAFAQAVNLGSPAHHWGFGPMPPIAGLTEGDIEAITAYVRENQRTRGFEPYPPS